MNLSLLYIALKINIRFDIGLYDLHILYFSLYEINLNHH